MDKIITLVMSHFLALVDTMLRDEDGVSHKTYCDLYQAFTTNGHIELWQKISRHVEATDGRFYLQEDAPVIYLDDVPDDVCPTCGDGFEVPVEDGDDCLQCQAEASKVCYIPVIDGLGNAKYIQIACDDFCDAAQIALNRGYKLNPVHLDRETKKKFGL